MKKLISIVVCLLAVVLLVCNFMGTRQAAESVITEGQEAPIAETAQPAETQAEVSTGPETTEASESASSDAPDLEAQYACIAENFNLWQTGGDTEASDPMYTVVDLDGDGRLEVIGAICEGSGLYTTAWYYEVNEDASGVSELNYAVAEGDSEPDIMVSSADVFTGGAVHWYIIDDILRVGAAEHYDIIYAIAKQGTEIMQQVIATEHSVTNADTGEETLTCTDSAGNEITPDAFSTAAADFFTGCNHETRSFDWRALTESDNLTAFARESYAAFAGNTSAN